MTSCVVGIGNAFRGDDAAGLRVVELLRDAVPAGVRLVECEGEPVSILDAWSGFDHVVLVDAMRSGAPAGTVRRVVVGEERLPAELAGPSTHLLGVADAVELARALGRLPERLVVFAVEGEGFDAGAELSAPVAAAVERVAAAIHEEVTN